MNLNRFLTGLALLASFQAFAGTITTNIAAVVDSGKTDRILILSSVDGRVYKMARDKEARKYFESLIGQNVSINFSMAGTEAIVNTITPVGAISEDVNLFVTEPNRSEFRPTDVGSVERANQLFGQLDKTSKDHSQCFKRAHMWAYDLWSRLGINSSKQFIFYTTRFMQLQDFDWWFHVAPTVQVQGVDYVIDGGFDFITTALKTNDWKAKVSPALKNITCPTIEHYDQYDKNRWGRLCYLRKMPMHYFRPLDLAAHDRNGVIKSGGNLSELQDARRAFKNGDEPYEALDTGKSTITH